MRYDGLDDIGQVYGSLSGIKNLIENKEYKKYYKFVEYNDLVKNLNKLQMMYMNF